MVAVTSRRIQFNIHVNMSTSRRVRQGPATALHQDIMIIVVLHEVIV